MLAIGTRIQFNRTPVWKCVSNYSVDLSNLTGTVEALDETGITILLDEPHPDFKNYENRAHWGSEELDHLFDVNEEWDYPEIDGAAMVRAAFMGFLASMVCRVLP